MILKYLKCLFLGVTLVGTPLLGETFESKPEPILQQDDQSYDQYNNGGYGTARRTARRTSRRTARRN